MRYRSNGKTTITLDMLLESREIRDLAMNSGMERGVAASHDRLNEILVSSQEHASSQGAA
jgi:hypothetical protein